MGTVHKVVCEQIVGDMQAMPQEVNHGEESRLRSAALGLSPALRCIGGC